MATASCLGRRQKVNKLQIEKLVEESFPEYNISVRFVTEDEIEKWAAVYTIDGETRSLALNKAEFSKSSEEVDQMVILLHELGHVPNDKITSVSDDEYLAQIWAIKKANEMKMPEVVQRLIQDIVSWGEFKWNEGKGQFRRYIIASKRFRKEFFNEKINKTIKV